MDDRRVLMALRVEIVDDGDGGAHVAKGHGLAGLAAIRADARYRGGDYYGAADDDGPHP